MQAVLMPFLVSLALVAALTPAVIAWARRCGWVAKPRADRWHRQPTALMGGIAIFAGTTAVWAATGGRELAVVLLPPAAGMFLLGLIDDRCRLRPHVKLLGQLFAAAYVVAHGVVFEALPMSLAWPLTFLWLVGLTNAMNLLDNMDGLAAGVGLISALTMAVYCLSQGNAEVAPAVLALAGGCAGFLIWNFPPARVFMGDCGSMFLGFSLATLAVMGTHRSAPNLVLAMLIPAGVLAVPIFDTALVSVARTWHGRSISEGGRDHSSHRLVRLGLSERGALLVFYLLSAGFGALALLASQLPLMVVALAAVLAASVLLLLGVFLGFLQVYERPADLPPSADDTVPEGGVHIEGQILYKRQLLQLALDVALVPVAFVGAHLLRFDFYLPLEHKIAVVDALPVVLVARLAGMAACRGYRGVWRYAGMSEGLAALAGSTAGSILAVGALLFLGRFRGLSRGAIVVDYVGFTLLAIVARTGYSLLRQAFALVPARGGPRVLILGLDDRALDLMSGLRDPLSQQRATVLGILDDNPGQQHRTVNGVPILGRLAELPLVLEELDVTCCLLGVPVGSRAAERILSFCRHHHISVSRELGTPPLA